MGSTQLAFVVLLSLLKLSVAYSEGAPESACGNQKPQHEMEPRIGEAPYPISLASKGDIFTVTVAADQNSNFPVWRGLLITVNDLRGSPAGPLVDIDQLDYQPQCDNGVTHISNTEKSFAQFRWEIPETENIEISITMVQDVRTFWVFKRTYAIPRDQTLTNEPIIRDVIDAANDRRRPGPDDVTSPDPTVVAPPDLANDGSRPRVDEPNSTVVAPADLGDDGRRSQTELRTAPADLGDDRRSRLDVLETTTAKSTTATTIMTTAESMPTTTTPGATVQIEVNDSMVSIETQRLDECGVTVSEIVRALRSRRTFFQFLECVFRDN